MKGVSRFHGPVSGAPARPKSVSKVRTPGVAGHGFARLQTDRHRPDGGSTRSHHPLAVILDRRGAIGAEHDRVN